MRPSPPRCQKPCGGLRERDIRGTICRRAEAVLDLNLRGWAAAAGGGLWSERRAEHLDTPVRHTVSSVFGNVVFSSNPLLALFFSEQGPGSRSLGHIALGNKKLWGSAADRHVPEKTGDAMSAPSECMNSLHPVRLELRVKSHPRRSGLLLVMVEADSQEIEKHLVPFSLFAGPFPWAPQAVESNFFGKLKSFVPSFVDLPALRQTPIVPDCH